MDSDTELAPAVRSILEAARGRSGGEGVVDVDARSLPDALAAAEADGRVPVIAEVKPTSPTAEGTRADDPVELAQAMVAGGAAAISVLTEPTHFDGSPEALTRVREAVDVPVLRKDFVLEEDGMDVVEADLLLLIARFVDDLEGLVAAARERGFQPLVEVHDRAELERAIDAGAEIVGVNNRDLARLEVELETFESVAPHARRVTGLENANGDGVSDVPDDVTLIAESGISSPADVRRMREAGADALLVGSAIMDHGTGDSDVTENTRRLTRAESTAGDST
ncbi:indole-3-glycerol phosphate synthase [Natrinema pellirubrum DSM 15624]|uniref:Indole-3-glycerol phosphate synthase n=1 Tax=Natrinema pellirubrum (strain DSM 15624 / CIP 106293 / JCM 10476 / NCIMB 786 / 157) TaxID=797303 RepID=L0JRR5_NATP1|nr:indole-3-glycerol phosphate synthase [Natrinema pellirubrum]AGB33081.1 Indole-3-glycerol phosphate synthase [Natrinema pellirubrum DSM 15624]ELY71747.1 indole-3-glycerol phosphate synthase [Natrinema pellirubrum DSM 15624]